MCIGRSLLFLFIGALIIGNVQIACGNGRTTPRPRDTLPLKAMCSQRAGGQLEIFRVRLIGGEGSDETLKITIEGVIEELALKEVKKLRFLTSQIDTDGFMKAAISRPDGAEETSAMVQVRSGDSIVRLKGFRNSGASVSIDLSSCKTITFSSASE